MRPLPCGCSAEARSRSTSVTRKGGYLGDARAGVVEHGKEDGIALSAPRGAVGGGQKGLAPDLVAGEEAEHGLVEALGGDRGDALGDGSRVGKCPKGCPRLRQRRKPGGHRHRQGEPLGLAELTFNKLPAATTTLSG